MATAAASTSISLSAPKIVAALRATRSIRRLRRSRTGGMGRWALTYALPAEHAAFQNDARCRASPPDTASAPIRSGRLQLPAPGPVRRARLPARVAILLNSRVLISPAGVRPHRTAAAMQSRVEVGPLLSRRRRDLPCPPPARERNARQLPRQPPARRQPRALRKPPDARDHFPRREMIEGWDGRERGSGRRDCRAQRPDISASGCWECVGPALRRSWARYAPTR